MSSIFRRAGVDAGTVTLEGAELERLGAESEAELVKVLMRFPEVVAASAERHTPHSVCDYLEDLAATVNSWYHAGNRDAASNKVGGVQVYGDGLVRTMFAYYR